jgi:hypothetical protein
VAPTTKAAHNGIASKILVECVIKKIVRPHEVSFTYMANSIFTETCGNQNRVISVISVANFNKMLGVVAQI